MPENVKKPGSVTGFFSSARADGQFSVCKLEQVERRISAYGSLKIDRVNAVLTKTADKFAVTAGGKIKYTLRFTNYSSVDMFGVGVCDKLSPKTALIQGSVEPAPQPGETLETGVCLGVVLAGQSKTLKYAVRVNGGAAGDILNTARAAFCFNDHHGVTHRRETESAAAVTPIVEAGLRIAKTADKTFVTGDDTEIACTLFVCNTGGVSIEHITVRDEIPAGMAYKRGSTVFNGAPPLMDMNPEDGIDIGDIGPNGCFEIGFTLTIL